MRCRVLLLVSVVVMAVVWGLSSCEKMIVDDESSSSTEQNEVKGNLILKISVAGVTPMETTRAEEADLSKFFTRLNIVAYQNGKKVKGVNQDVMAENFGTIGMSLEPGTYQVLVVAHSSEGNPETGDITRIKFTNENGFTDTFYSFTEIEVVEETKEYSISIKRLSSMLRFIINDNIPSDVYSIDFTLTGGSGAFNAQTGFGSVHSIQRKTVVIDHTKSSPYAFDLYTILWEEFKSDGLKLDVVPRKADGKTPYNEGRTIKNITVVRNAITELSGNFFTDSPGGNDSGGGDNTGGDNNGGNDTGGGTTELEDSIATSFNIVVDPTWSDSIIHKTY